MKQVISIGKQDFASLRDENYFFIDKSNFIKEWWEAGDEITLIARPRRFGKTLNMSRRCPPRRALLFLLIKAEGECLSF